MATILIVDDSQADLQFMGSILNKTPHTVRMLTDPHAVCTSVSTERPDLILLDVVMPEMNGYEVLRSLKRQEGAQTIKVIFVSSKGGDTDIKWGLRQGAIDYLQKPYTADQVLGLLTKHLPS